MASRVPRCINKQVSFAVTDEKTDMFDAASYNVAPYIKSDGEPRTGHLQRSVLFGLIPRGHQQRPVHVREVHGRYRPPALHTGEVQGGRRLRSVHSGDLCGGHQQRSVQRMRPVLGGTCVDRGKKPGVRKVLVRHPEAALPTSKAVVRSEKTFLEENYPSEEVFAFHQDLKGTYKARYAVPELYSSLRLAKKIQSTKEEENEESPLSSDILTSVREAVSDRAAATLNFSPEEQLYKGLVQLEVNDEILTVNAQEHHSMWKLKKHKEPKLVDFQVPSFSDEYAVLNEPSLTAIGKIRSYCGFSTFKKKVGWEHSEEI